MAPQKNEPEKPQVQQPVEIPRPRLEVLERGLQNVFGLPSTKIELRDPDMETHWCNTAITGQLRKYLDAGYLKVRPEYLKDAEQVSFAVSPDGFVTTGPRGEEILMYTLRSNAIKRQREKTRINMQKMADALGQKAELTQAVGDRFGDQAADYITRHVDTKDSYERVERIPE